MSTPAETRPAPPNLTVAEFAADTRHLLTRRGLQLSVRVAEFEDGSGCAILVGDPERHRNPLVRIHSRCLYGDAFDSEDCDCGPELELALDKIQAAGAGVVLYLEQEGRGAGLTVKAQGLRLSESADIDTFDSYARLGFDHDLRSFVYAAQFLTGVLGLSRIRLLTNNPRKAHTLAEHGLLVETEALPTTPRNRRALRYLESKRRKAAHHLPSRGAWHLEIWGVRLGVAALAFSGVGAILLLARELLIVHELLVLAVVFTHPVARAARLRARMLTHRLRGLAARR